jgi:general secretion pathway protein H
MVVIALGALLTGALIAGVGSATNARLKSSCTLVASAIRTAYARATATAKPVRVVFDFEQRRLWLEEGSSPMLTTAQDPTMTGGADPATALEKAASEQASQILKGPRAPKPLFKSVKEPTLDEGNKTQGRPLERGIRFWEIHTAHQVTPLRQGRAYLYMWPGGMTETAYLQISKGEEDANASNSMTLSVHPLTGRVRVLSGLQTVRFPSATDSASEREDRGVF